MPRRSQAEREMEAIALPSAPVLLTPPERSRARGRYLRCACRAARTPRKLSVRT